MSKVIYQNDIPALLKHLRKSYSVFAPVSKNKETTFDKVADSKNIVLDYQTTILPPKIYFLPPEEELFRITNGRVYENKIKKPFVVFGLNLKDLAAIVYLDQIMGKNPADTFYQKRRELSTLIAVSQERVGVPSGGDLILEKVSAGTYRAIVLTEKGRKIAGLDLFKEKRITEKAEPKGKSSMLEKMLLDSELIARAVEWS